MTAPNRLTTLALATLLAAACDSPTGPSEGEGGLERAPVIAAARFTLPLPSDPVFVTPAEAAASPNPWFPLVPGARWSYESETGGGLETTLDEISGATRMIDGVEATELKDVVLFEGDVIELTFDWYAQDTEGNVWYLGESSCEWEAGEYAAGDEYLPECGPSGDPSGSWETGVDGAEAGIIMWADPSAVRGRPYRQEFYEDEAEDMAKVLRTGLEVEVPVGTLDECIETMDSTPLDPGHREHKFYCAGWGLVLEVQPQGGRERNELVDTEGLPAGG